MVPVLKRRTRAPSLDGALDILYSAQHLNQHKDAFAWIIYHGPICRVYQSVNDVSACYYIRMLVPVRTSFNLRRRREKTYNVLT